MIHNRPTGQNLFFRERRDQELMQSANAYADFREPHNIARSSNEFGPQAIQRAVRQVNLMHEEMLNLHEQVERVREQLEISRRAHQRYLDEFKDYLDEKLFQEKEEEEEEQSICCRIF